MKPKSLEAGLLTLAQWFDAIYQDANNNDEVQQDLRRWAREHMQLQDSLDRVEAKLQELIKTIEIVNWDFDGGMVEITEQEYRLIKAAITAANELLNSFHRK